jgi:5-oxopent-3-ene-1,2,5-tricarboxylate decarboxylase/2-hydroxyhepta-2,4-diene-1,7-dioate isomerase
MAWAGARVSGTVYGVLLNDAASIEARRASFVEPPYRVPPVAPILYIKPRNTLAGDGAAVAVPADPGCVRIDATIGAVIGRTAVRVTVDDALSFVTGYAIVSDVTLPHESVYRPAVRNRCRDGFCPIGAVASAEGFDIAAATITVSINGSETHRRDLSNLVRPLPMLLADMTAFMTLEPGDIVMLGAPDDAPIARPGDVVTIDVPGLATLTHTLVAEAHR